MACNGMASSSSFPSAFIFPVQAPYEEDTSHTNPLIPPDLQELRGQLLALGGAGTAPALGKRSMSFPFIETAGDDDLSDDGSVAGEKKKRLNVEQVRALEKSFDLGNKLEPERKMQLARVLGLRPRQVAIWFQNRRARWKSKQLERDYDVLKTQFQAMRTENESLLAHNKKLQAEILALRGRETPELINLNKDTEGSCSNRSENSCSEINLDISRASVNESHIPAPQIFPHFQTIKPAEIDQLLHNSCKPEFLCPKVESDGGAAPEGSFSNLLCSMADQSVFWPWPDHHSFH